MVEIHDGGSQRSGALAGDRPARAARAAGHQAPFFRDDLPGVRRERLLHHPAGVERADAQPVLGRSGRQAHEREADAAGARRAVGLARHGRSGGEQPTLPPHLDGRRRGRDGRRQGLQAGRAVGGQNHTGIRAARAGQAVLPAADGDGETELAVLLRGGETHRAVLRDRHRLRVGPPCVSRRQRHEAGHGGEHASGDPHGHESVRTPDAFRVSEGRRQGVTVACAADPGLRCARGPSRTVKGALALVIALLAICVVTAPARAALVTLFALPPSLKNPRQDLVRPRRRCLVHAI